MARLIFVGSETGGLNDEWVDNSQITEGLGASLITTTVRSGKYALQLTDSSPNFPYAKTKNAPGTPTTIFSRSYIWITALPNVETVIHSLGGTVDNPARFTLNTTGTITSYNRPGGSDVNLGTGTAKFVVGAWNLLEIKAVQGAGTGIIEVRIGGVVDQSYTGLTVGGTAGTFTNLEFDNFGIASQPATGMNVIVDDVSGDDAAYCGPGAIIARQGITGTPANDQWTKNGAATAALCWSDTPFSTATNCSNAVATQKQGMLIGPFSANQSGHGVGVIRAIDVINSCKVSLIAKCAAGTQSMDVVRRIGGTDTGTTVTLTTTDAYYEGAFFTATTAQLDTAQAGATNNSSNSITVEDVWMQVEFVPTPFAQDDWPTPPALPDAPTVRNTPVVFRALLAPGLKPFKQTDWPVPVAPIPPENLKTWTWAYNKNLIGLDKFPPGYKEWVTPAQFPYYDRASFQAWYNKNLIGLDKLPFRQLDWPNPTPPADGRSWTVSRNLPLTTQFPIGKTIYDLPAPFPYFDRASFSVRYNLNLIGKDQLPFRQQNWPNPTPPPDGRSWVSYISLALTAIVPVPPGKALYDLPAGLPYFDRANFAVSYNLNLIGQDKLPFRQQDWPLWQDYDRAIQLRTWVDQTKLLLRGQDQFPIRQRDWPVPLDFDRSIQLRTWIDQTKILLIPTVTLPLNQKDWPLPIAAQGPILTWTSRYNLNLIGKDVLPRNQKDWPLPNRGPAPLDQFIGYTSPFIPATAFFPASYFLLQPHYIMNRFLDAWVTVTEGVEIPVGWVPTLAVDPLNTQAVTAFYNAGPRPAWQGPEWNWQNYQTITSLRQNVQLQPTTHWVSLGNGFYKLTGLGSSLDPVGV